MHRIGLIGTGRIGIIHGLNVAANPKGSLVALCDPDTGAASQLARRTGAELGDVDSIIAANDIDAALICSPTDTHSDLIERCARAGKAILRKADRSFCRARSARGSGC